MIYVKKSLKENLSLSDCFVIWMAGRFLNMGKVVFVKEKEVEDCFKDFGLGYHTKSTVVQRREDYSSDVLKFIRELEEIGEDEYEVLLRINNYVSYNEFKRLGKYTGYDENGVAQLYGFVDLECIYQASMKRKGVKKTIKSMCKIFDMIFEYLTFKRESRQ